MSPTHVGSLTDSAGANSGGGMKPQHNDVSTDPTDGPAPKDKPAKSDCGSLRVRAQIPPETSRREKKGLEGGGSG